MRILKVIGLLLEYPDELLWENRDDALALVRADVPSLTPFVGDANTQTPEFKAFLVNVEKA